MCVCVCVCVCVLKILNFLSKKKICIPLSTTINLDKLCISS